MKRYIVVLVVEDKPMPDEDYFSIYEIEQKITSSTTPIRIFTKVLSISELDAAIKISVRL